MVKMIKKIYLLLLIFYFFLSSFTLALKYYDFVKFNDKMLKNEIKKQKESEIFWHFIFGLMVFYITFHLANYIKNTNYFKKI